MRKIKIFIPFVSIIFFFISCLKKDTTYYDASASPSVISFDNTGTPAYDTFNLYTADLGVVKVGSSSSFNINVLYAGASDAPQSITVNIKIDTTALNLFNDAEGTDYLLPPTDAYKLPTSVTIPKGAKTGQVIVPITVASDYDFNAAYVLPVSISSVSYGNVSTNLGTVIYSLVVRNVYDGEYDVTGTFSSSLNATYAGSYPKTIDLVTQGATSNAYYDPNLNGGYFGYAFSAGGSGSYFGNFDPEFHFDATTGNVVSMSNYWTDPAPRSRNAQLDPSGVNKFYMHPDGSHVDSINVSYYMLQSGAIANKITEHFVYKGARD